MNYHFALPRLVLALALFSIAACAPMQTHSPQVDGADYSRYESRLPQSDAKALHAYARYRMLLADQRFEAARESLMTARRLDPDDAYLRLEAARLHQKLNQTQEAISEATALVEDERYGHEALLMLGNLHMNLGQDIAAADYYRRALSLDPERPETYLHLATALARGGLSADALDVLEILVERRPDSFMGHYYRARLYRELGMLDAAERALMRVLEIEPGFEGGYRDLGELYQGRNKDSQALKLYRRGLEQLPGSDALRHRLVRLLIEIGSYEAAEDELLQMLRSNPEDAEALRKLGLLHFEQRRWDEAVEAFERLYRLRPELDQAIYYYASALEESGRREAALEVFSEVPQGSDLYLDARLHMAYLLHRSGQTEAGVAVLQEILKSGLPTVEVYRYLAALYEEQGRLEVAASTLRKGLEIYGDAVALAYRLGVVLEARGDMAGSEAAFRRALRIDPDHADTLNHLAYMFAERGENLEEALELGLRALEIEDSGHVVDTVGWTYFRLGRLQEAREYLERAAALLPEDPVVLEHLGDLYRMMGESQKARSAYEQALELGGANDVLNEKLQQLGVAN